MVHKHQPESTAAAPPFENDVKMYGTQAKKEESIMVGQFENDVKMYGTQAGLAFSNSRQCLRMM